VMKTFNRVSYGGGGLPDEAIVTAVLRRDEEDVHAGDPLFEVRAAGT
jgi:acetyl-CoA carboxylase biotin carboxyl carrier protein